MPERQYILVATLGSQPQVVTNTLDLLLAKGYLIKEVIVLHPRVLPSSRLERALQRLREEFRGPLYYDNQPGISFRSQVLSHNGEPLDDIYTDEHADGTLNTIQTLLAELKAQGYHVHLSLSSGRRLMSLLAMSVAMLNFDRHDHIWHLYTPELLKKRIDQGEVMHLPLDSGIQLIETPFLALGAYISTSRPSFSEEHDRQQRRLDAERLARCRSVIQEVSPAELKVLQAFAHGLKPQQVAKELNIAMSTVNTHKSKLFEYCRNAWNLPLNEHLDYHFLYTNFEDFFASQKPPFHLPP